MKKKKKIYVARCIFSLLLALCMVCCLMPGTAFAQENDTTAQTDVQASDSEHVLCEENNWNISDELIMPGESFYTKPKYTFNLTANGICQPIYEHAALTLREPGGDGLRLYTNYLVRSTADDSKFAPLTDSYNLIKMAYDKGDLLSLQNNENYNYDRAQEALKTALTEANREVTVGYQNNTDLPVVLEQVRGTSTVEDVVKGGAYGLDVIVQALSTHNWACTIRFFEPYYLISYELDGVDGEYTEEEKKALPDRYYIQRERQEIVLKNPVRPGYHFKGWYGGLVTLSNESEKDGSTILSFDWEHNLYKYLGYVGDQTLSAHFGSGYTVTFNPNGGQLKDGDSAIREIDWKDAGSNLFFDIGKCIPVREGYRFVGWCTSPSAGEDSLIKNTEDSEWIYDWSGTHTGQYDIQLYAKWEKEDPCAKGHKPQEMVTQATAGKDGKIVTKCSVCEKTLSETPIKKASDIRLSATSYIYDGKAKTPSVSVKDSAGKTLKVNTDYTVTYAKERKNVGNYSVTIKLKGNYSGTVKKTFTIQPKSTSILKLTPGNKKLTVKWKKQATQTTGYQIQYATSSKFKDAKTITVSKNKTTSKTILKLKARKKYYVRMRSYRTVKVNGKSAKLYSAWSKVRTGKTK